MLTLLVVGESGVGKSSLIKELCGHVVELPAVGLNPNGVSKSCKAYICRLGALEFRAIDTPGVGDQTVKVGEIVPQITQVLRGHLTGVTEVHGVLMCSMINFNRVKLGAGIVAALMQACTLGGKNKWDQVLLIGTQKDRCSATEIQDFKQDTLGVFNQEITKYNPSEPGCITKVACVNIQTSKVRADFDELAALLQKFPLLAIQPNPAASAEQVAKVVRPNMGLQPERRTVVK